MAKTDTLIQQQKLYPHQALKRLLRLVNPDLHRGDENELIAKKLRQVLDEIECDSNRWWQPGDSHQRTANRRRKLSIVLRQWSDITTHLAAEWGRARYWWEEMEEQNKAL